MVKIYKNDFNFYKSYKLQDNSKDKENLVVKEHNNSYIFTFTKNNQTYYMKCYLFEDEETGDTFLIEGGYWNWGDYVTYDIDIPFTELAQRIKDAKIKTFKE